ncbi:TraB/GumN family protein [Marinimicrobium sp. ABcell2]|uniref:TraB/GumN family protein n=1 Tax=Marinimicrobium sp. ABcell2 TaxID=3069751 RepID=UPI0027B5A658|nr:TraB/GumN family protein [Marinimicrobium sp. ABcell2]MDQ2077076.1 TraB/GumN family protein [Marinimicrobium sp. ABcell2]
MIRFLLLLVLLAAPLAYAQTSLWEVSNGRHHVIIGGSVQFLSWDDYPLPTAFDQAYAIADKVHFQTDLGAISKPGFGLRAMQSMTYRDGRTLRSVLSPEVWEALREFSGERSLPSNSLIMFRPAFAVMTLSVLEGRRLGLGRGPDGYFYSRAHRTGKPVGYLESVDQQLLFLGRLNELDPDTLVTATLNELSTMEDQSEQVVNAWRRGDMAALDQLTGAKLRAESPELYRSLVTDRNEQWVDQIAAMLKTPDLDYVVLDAMHLSGPGNLLELLKAQGFSVRPLVL